MPEILKKWISLQTANGPPLQIEGQTQLQQNGARIYLDLRALRPGDEYVALTKSGTFHP